MSLLRHVGRHLRCESRQSKDRQRVQQVKKNLRGVPYSMDIVKVFSQSDSEHSINIQGTEDQPLFQATHVGQVLGIAHIKTSICNLPPDYKEVRTVATNGGPQAVTFLTEEGLYSVIFKSRLPIAQTFRRWVFSVLKEIRTTGRYEMDLELKKKSQELLALQTENGLLKNKAEEKASFLYAFKVDRSEDDEHCRIKIGRSNNVDVRQGPYLQTSPDGRMVTSIKVPENRIKSVEYLTHKILKHTNTCIRNEVYKTNVEVAVQVMQLVPDLIEILEDGRWDVLQELVRVGKWHLRGVGEEPSIPAEAAASTDVRVDLSTLQQDVQTLMAGQQELCNLVRGASKPMAEAKLPPKLPNIASSVPEVQRGWDFNRFVEECCTLEAGVQETSSALVGRHKVWAKMGNRELLNALLDYLKTRFKAIRFVTDGHHRHGFEGVRVKPVVRALSEVPSQAELFVQDRCVDAPQSRLYVSDLKREFYDWRKQEDASYEDNQAELAEVHKYLTDVYFKGNSIWRPEFKVNEAGWHGLCLPGDEDAYSKRPPGGGSKPVNLYDAQTGEVLNAWPKVGDAAAALGVSTAQISYSIRTKKLRDGTLLKYGVTV